MFCCCQTSCRISLSDLWTGSVVLDLSHETVKHPPKGAKSPLFITSLFFFSLRLWLILLLPWWAVCFWARCGRAEREKSTGLSDERWGVMAPVFICHWSCWLIWSSCHTRKAHLLLHGTGNLSGRTRQTEYLICYLVTTFFFFLAVVCSLDAAVPLCTHFHLARLCF